MQLEANRQQILTHLKSCLLSPDHGWKTSHFWGPVSNWGLVLASIRDSRYKSANTIDINMTSSLIIFSSCFIRFAWKVRPRNILLLVCHAFNLLIQSIQLNRALQTRKETITFDYLKTQFNQFNPFKKRYAMVGLIYLSLPSFSKFIRNTKYHGMLNNILTSPVGPTTIFFWAPMSKWLITLNNLKNFDKPIKCTYF